MLTERLLLIAVLPACCLAQRPTDDLRQRVLQTAKLYATFEWRASSANVLHGVDADGVRVDTPDVGFDPAGWRADGSPNRGMPYSWGGFTSIEEFQAGLSQGLFAGLVPASERARASRQALGLDCSGYVARCLDLPVKQTTRSLGHLCVELDGYDSLQPGDMLNKYDSHVALFVDWADSNRSKLRVFEAARLGVKESVYETATTKREGFVPLRYRLLDPKWQPMDEKSLGAPAWQSSPASMPAFEGAVVKDPQLDAHPLEDAVAGGWVRYAVARNGSASLRRTLLATSVGKDVDLQCIDAIGGKVLPTGRTTAKAQALSPILLDLLAFYEPLDIKRVMEHTVERGFCTLGERRFPVRRHTLTLTAETTVRHQAHAAWLDVTVILSNEVPLCRVVAAEFTLAIDWRLTGRREDASPLQTSLVLEAFGTKP